MKKEFNFFYNSLKKELRFEFIEDIKLKEVLYQFFAYVYFIYYNDIKEINNINLIELKKHTIFLYIGSIIEAVLYYYISKKLKDNDKKKKKYLKTHEFRSVQNLSEIDSNKKYYICELLEKEITLNETINFHQLLNGAKDNKFIDKEIIIKADKIRKNRNTIHINVYMNGEEETLYDLKELFIQTKDILDYVEDNL